MQTKLIERIDVRDKVLGKALYADDLRFPGMLHAKAVHCPHPHAKILAIHTQDAVGMPGVVGVYTAKDITGINQLPKDKPMLAADIVRSAGDGVAVVAAETAAQAAAAALRVQVDYEVLPGVFDPEQALRDELLVHADTNLACEHKLRKGDVTAGFAEADVVLERTFQTQRIHHSAMETDAAVIVPENGGITAYCACKGPYNVKKALARTCGLNQNNVRLIQPAIGGSFGGKDCDMVVVATRAAVVALDTGRPCKMVWSREEALIEGSKRHPFKLHYKIGAKMDGRIIALQINGISDVGAYLSRSLATIWRATVEATGPYEIPHVATHIRAAFTNNVYCDAVRGFGSPQVDFASESLINELAAELDLSPLEIRRINCFREGSVAATGQVLDNVSLPECLDKLEDIFPAALEGPQMRDGKLRGRGIACLYRGESYGAAFEAQDVAAADLRVQEDGSVNLYASISEVGQGGHTIMVQVAAETLGIDSCRITMTPVDTAYVPDSGVTAGSRGTITGGNVVRLAATQMRERLAAVAAKELGIPAGEIQFRQNGLYRGNAQDVSMSFREAVALLFASAQSPTAHGWWVAPKTDWDYEKHQGNTYYSYSYGAAGAEVEIDLVSGKIDVTELVCIHDIGRILNYAEAKAQIAGGVAMALGYTLMEDVGLQDGIVGNQNFDSYLLPTFLDFKKTNFIPLAYKEANNPMGVHGVGEASTALVAPSVANAIRDAMGVHMRTLPIRLEDIRRELDRRKEEIPHA